MKCNLRSFETAMECSCPECIDVSMALLAAGMLSVKTIISLHPVAVALVIASRIAKISRDSQVFGQSTRDMI